MRELCVSSFPLCMFSSLQSEFGAYIAPPKHASRDVAHKCRNTPFGLQILVERLQSPRSLGIFLKKKTQTGNSLRLKRRHVCIWHKVVPVKTVNHLCSQIAGQPPTWGGGWVRSTLLPTNLCLGKARKHFGPEPRF